ncbi:ferritin-like domain-containing protein [Steroidobacter sp.]|uniref:YciE/YciF ferroxidase family protein n=1 Tax=Steroidobacter sp. TaxID=1978227 RepID=UPI001A604D29|nr:DUF892 family protein [Steroidobacter sp.]MBL8270566.1 DUF892 family protein [Steroidobacter sp.]
MATKKKPAQPAASAATQLLVSELQEIYNAETQWARAAVRFIKAAQAEWLQQYLDRRMETGSQLSEDLQAAFEQLQQSPGRKKNGAVEGLLSDVRERMQAVTKGPARDAVLIAGVQKVEHYCMAAWGTSRALAQALGIESVAETMGRALDEGRDLDRQLTELAEQEILPKLLGS